MARPRDINSGKEESPKVRISKASIKEAMDIFKYMNPYRGHFIWGLLFIALSAGTTMSFPFLLKKLIDSAHGDLKGPFSFPPGTIALLMIALLTLQMTISFMRIYLFTYVGEHAVADM